MPTHLSPADVSRQNADGLIDVIDVREPMEYATGHIAGSRNIPLNKLTSAPLPQGPVVLVCQSGKRSQSGANQLQRLGYPHPVTQLEGGLLAWQDARLPLSRKANAPLPLMRQVQIGAGSLVLLGVVLSQLVGPSWIWLSGLVGAGLIFAGVSGFCGMARLLAVMPWNRV
jgi:rhodanese-related sulfurtransferase